MSTPRPTPPTERFRLLVEIRSDRTCPAAVTLRRALKCLLRTFGIRCVSVVETPADGRLADRPGSVGEPSSGWHLSGPAVDEDFGPE